MVHATHENMSVSARLGSADPHESCMWTTALNIGNFLLTEEEEEGEEECWGGGRRR